VAARQRLICRSEQLAERAKGWRFTVEAANGEPIPAFAVRYRGKVYAYLNRCSHVSVQLDWMEGEFFDFSRLYLVCATHGAAYYPDSGRCAGGPCNGRALTALQIEEREGNIYLLENEETHG
jgi:nitrite reductase/ring-hydroxylating ferredoxin subunit